MPRLHPRLMFVPLALGLCTPVGSPADEVIDAAGEPLVVPAEQLAGIGAAAGQAPTANASPPASAPAPQAPPTGTVPASTVPVSTVIEQTDWQAASVATVATAGPAAPAASAPAASAPAAADTAGDASGALRRLPRQAWNGGKAVVGAAWRDLMHPPPRPAMRAGSPEDARASCETLYYQALELMQVQQAGRTLPAYWDDNRNQAIGFLGMVATPLYYLWGVTATQSHHRSQADLAMNARLDALHHAAAQQHCFIR